MSEDELIILEFLKICIPSLNPDSYIHVKEACAELCNNRKGVKCTFDDILLLAHKETK